MDTTTRKIRRLSPGRRLRFVLFLYWLHICEAIQQRKGFHVIRYGRSVNPMYPTPRMMAAVTFGMAAVSIVSWGLVSLGIPLALYLMPLYLVYVAGILGIRSTLLSRRVRNG